MSETLSDEKYPHAKGGSRDPRVRAVEGTAAIERVLEVVEEHLISVRQGGRMRRIGHRLRLRYDPSEQRFRWLFRVGPRQWQRIGARVPEEIKQSRRPGTRAQIDTVERWLDIRRCGVRALQMIEWCVKEGVKWTEPVITLRWKGLVPGRVTWSFPMRGGRLRKGGLKAEQGPPSWYLRDVEALCAGRSMEGDGGPATVTVEGLVNNMHRLDAELEGCRMQLRGVIRIYYIPQTDVWQIRQITGQHFSVYCGKKVVDIDRVKWLTQTEKEMIGRVEDLLERRGRIKRALQVVATITDTMRRWPEGDWQIRGEGGNGASARWVAHFTQCRVMARPHERERVGQRDGQDDDWEEAVTEQW